MSKKFVNEEASSARVKKLCWHTTIGDISVAEPQYRRASKRIRPFAQSAKVSHRSCSRQLQRGVTDFGAGQAFAQVMDKLVAHYGQMSYHWRDFQDRVGATATVTDKSTRAAALTRSGDARDTLLGGGISAFSPAYNSGRVNIETPAALAIDTATARTQGHFDKLNFSLLRLQSLGGAVSGYFALSG